MADDVVQTQELIHINNPQDNRIPDFPTQEQLDRELFAVCSIVSYPDQKSKAQDLLKRGANANTILPGSPTGFAPLHHAAQEGDLELAELLVKYRADVNVLDSYNGTPLHDAAALYCPGMTQFLIDQGADLNVKTTNQRTPLHIAAWNGKYSTASILVKSGCSLDGIDKLGKTALDKFLCRSTISQDTIEVASTLIFHGASRCLEVNYAKAMEIVLLVKAEIIASFPKYFPELPTKWKLVIVELLFVLSQCSWRIPKELYLLMVKAVVRHWPIVLTYKKITDLS